MATVAEKIQRLQGAIVSVLADMIENRDKITGGHVERTSQYVKILIKEMKARGLYAEETRDWNVDAFVSSARLHDVGKITISDLILNKPGKLTDDEFETIKTHAFEGERIICKIIAQTYDVDDNFLQNAKLIAGNHHERWDGTGYPRKLKGENIPLQGRIMAIVDVYDALVSDRPYKKAFSHEKAVEIIKDDAGKHFDPKIADVFLDIKDKFMVKETRTSVSM